MAALSAGPVSQEGSLMVGGERMAAGGDVGSWRGLEEASLAMGGCASVSVNVNVGVWVGVYE